MRRAAFAALALALAAGVTARAQSPSLPAPSASGPAAPAWSSILDPTPSAQRLTPLSPVRAPQTPTSLLRKNPFPPPAPELMAAPAPRAPQAAPVVASSPPPLVVAPAPPGFDPRVCAGGGLSAAQAQACRDEFQRKIEADRARIEARREAERIAREERAARRKPTLKPRGASLDFFLVEDLVYGDVVMTDKGARVFIGKRDETPRREDFVTLDDPRSPRRDIPVRLKRAPHGL